MASLPIARLGDTSTHGGSIVTSASRTYAEGQLIARVGDMLACPIHGLNPIVSGSPDHFVEGQSCARTSSTTACGASIIGGASRTLSS